MIVGHTHSSINKDEALANTQETEILSSVFPKIDQLPCLINSPLRQDNHPSFSIYTNSAGKVRYIDYATKDTGGLLDLLCAYWNCSFQECLDKIKSLHLSGKGIPESAFKASPIRISNKASLRIEVKTRPWKDSDISYWQSYGCSINLLKYAEVYPISHKIIFKNGHKYTFIAPQYSYVFIERKEGKVTKKIYSPFATKYKWITDNDHSVIGLWNKVPKTGPVICICSSLKDAICLWTNAHIPCIYIQGEAYSISETAVNELKRRFKTILICLDNDEAGIKDSQKLQQQTGFLNIILPPFEGGKDISDAYKIMGKEKFNKTIVNHIIQSLKTF